MTVKVPQLAKDEWLYQTVEGDAYRQAEHDAWMAMYYATYGWHKMFAGSIGSYPTTPIKWEKLVERAWENAQGHDEFEKKRGLFSGIPRNPQSLLDEAKPIYEHWQAQTTYGTYVKKYHASGKTYLPEPLNSYGYPWFISSHKVGEDETWVHLEVNGEPFAIDRKYHNL